MHVHTSFNCTYFVEDGICIDFFGIFNRPIHAKLMFLLSPVPCPFIRNRELDDCCPFTLGSNASYLHVPTWLLWCHEQESRAQGLQRVHKIFGSPVILQKFDHSNRCWILQMTFLTLEPETLGTWWWLWRGAVFSLLQFLGLDLPGICNLEIGGCGVKIKYRSNGVLPTCNHSTFQTCHVLDARSLLSGSCP